MKFFIDANLPSILVSLFEANGYFAIHTSSLPKGNSTLDHEILSLVSDHIVVTKDADFYQSFLLRRIPYKLVYARVGNMRAKGLLKLFSDEIPTLVGLLEQHDCIELHRDKIVVID
ncbi:MAG: DUF5615 family PIN-like protein [Bacteroidota bacterium]